jgi:MoaA/NifB/PqqE/SkfB family radical SAM enzyme
LDRTLDSASPAASAASAPPTGPTATIPSVDWWITSRCNLVCDFCFGPQADRDPVGLRETILHRIERSSAAVVTFCGGEPLVVREIGRYARRLAESGKGTVLNTNGLLLRKRLEQGLDLDFAAVGLSIDGSTELVHRAMRGAKANLGEVLRAAQLVADRPGTSLKIGTVVSAVNRGDLPSLAALVGRLKPDVWRLYQYSERGVQNSGQQRHRLSEEEFLGLVAEAALRATPVPTAPSSESQTAGCLIVDPNGNVIQPIDVGYITHGNCLHEPLDDIWARIPSRVSIIENKRWLSVLADRPRETVGDAQHVGGGLQWESTA